MPTVLLIRHGRTAANASGVLAGRTPGVHLDDKGREQCNHLAARLSPVTLAGVVVSPLERTQETASLILEGREVPVHLDDRLAECRYGEWTGQSLKVLSKDPLWKVVQSHPSAVTCPGPDGESMIDMQHRAVSAIREWNSAMGADAIYAVVSHGDVIKAILADALGMHLDQFQRIHVDPASVSIVEYTAHRPFVHRTNDTSGDLGHLTGKRTKRPRSSDAAVGGGAGR
jgi:probable phosphomutase (TIGR03848 family)